MVGTAAQMKDSKSSKAPTAKAVAAVSALITALAVAFSEAVGSGLGTAFLDLFRSEPPPVTASAGEQVHECGTALFVGDPRAQRVLASPVPRELDWTAFRRQHGAAVAGSSVVEVSIQGETARKITLTGVDFEVERRARPPGAVFSNPCGDALQGRSLVVDLDRTPPAVVASTQDPEGIAGVPDSRPIRFPWTVSVTDPLLLYIVARTKRCDCTWRATVPWRSGGKSGTIAIDNAGRGYTVVGSDRVPYYLNGGDKGWQEFDPR
jgi:hypothetical protein